MITFDRNANNCIRQNGTNEPSLWKGPNKELIVTNGYGVGGSEGKAPAVICLSSFDPKQIQFHSTLTIEISLVSSGSLISIIWNFGVINCPKDPDMYGNKECYTTSLKLGEPTVVCLPRQETAAVQCSPLPGTCK